MSSEESKGSVTRENRIYSGVTSSQHWPCPAWDAQHDGGTSRSCDAQSSPAQPAARRTRSQTEACSKGCNLLSLRCPIGPN